MAVHKHYYLVYLQYLGYRYSGWAKQPNTSIKTVHGVLDKTLAYLLGNVPFKSLGCSRTDAKVSADQTAFEIFINESLDIEKLKKNLNLNLPLDIKVLEIKEVDRNFNIIQTPKIKEYHYLFTYGEKPHPFCAPLLTHFKNTLDIGSMQEGAMVFEGRHNFKAYCTEPKKNTVFEREILYSKIEVNTTYKANFFPENTYLYKVKGKGFLRHQIRLMIGHLVQLGYHEIAISDIEKKLTNLVCEPVEKIVPATGLILSSVTFD